MDTRYLHGMEDLFLKMEGTGISWRSSYNLEEAIQKYTRKFSEGLHVTQNEFAERILKSWADPMIVQGCESGT